MGYRYIPEINMVLVEASTGDHWKITGIDKTGYGLTWGYIIKKLRSKETRVLSGFEIRKLFHPLHYTGNPRPKKERMKRSLKMPVKKYIVLHKPDGGRITSIELTKKNLDVLNREFNISLFQKDMSGTVHYRVWGKAKKGKGITHKRNPKWYGLGKDKLLWTGEYGDILAIYYDGVNYIGQYRNSGLRAITDSLARKIMGSSLGKFVKKPDSRNPMTLDKVVYSKEEAKRALSRWRGSGFTAKAVQKTPGKFHIYVGSFGDRYRKLKRLSKLKRRYGRVGTKRNPVSTKGAVEIYGNIKAIEAKKGPHSNYPNENFRHDFKPGTRILGLPDGSILIKGKKKLWKNFDA